MASNYGSYWDYPASARMAEGTPMLSMPSVPLTAGPLGPSGRPSSTLEPDRFAAGASPTLGNQRPRSALGLRISSGVSPVWNGTPLSAAALTFSEKVGGSIERPKSAGPTPNASMFKGNAQVAAAGAASPPPLPSSAAADSARLSNPPATATGLRPAPLTLAANAYRDSFYHPSGSKSAVATTFMRSMFELGSSTANTKSDAPAQSNVAGGYLGVSAGLTAPGGSRGASPAAPPGRLPISAPGPNSAWRSTTAAANAALSPSASSPSRLTYTSPRPVLTKTKLGQEVPDALTSVSKVGRTPTGPKRGTEPDPADVHLLKTDIPGWLRSLRLHKYTTNFAGKTWQEVITLCDDDLQKMGVAAMGARNKMLRVFESTRAALAITEPMNRGAREQVSQIAVFLVLNGGGSCPGSVGFGNTADVRTEARKMRKSLRLRLRTTGAGLPRIREKRELAKTKNGMGPGMKIARNHIRRLTCRVADGSSLGITAGYMMSSALLNRTKRRGDFGVGDRR
ncbi:MAG: hypothetical protein BJ554DRAFT_6945 [Olpidium bornovanus]|uniref:SAM domain-containing protein n=1 Tax=Olpidium bornovanus TaxID=278681 RepID=A0A8H7ZX82_9FUNG|nr:MAG: hypothetical protein BJ554DRAFT_6945 [Olpidium bornovanus]